MKAFLARLIFVVVCLVVTGCGWMNLYEKGTKFDYQDEVGIAKLSVISVTPWEEIEKALIPNFKLEASEALQKVGDSVRVVDEAYLRSLSATLQLSLPSGSTPKSETDSSKIETPKTPGQTSGNAPGQASGSSPGQPIAASSQLLSSASQYQLATALFQEVQLLNSYIKHVMKEENSEAYLISMDVALLPARKAEVDAFALISFVGVPNEQCDPDLKQSCYSAPTVMPAILSEDMELSRHTRQVQNLRQIALSIAGAVQGVGGRGAIDQKAQELLKATGRDVNTLQIVASAATNALIVRFGAGYGVETDYALFPQARRVHALLFVPKDQTGNSRKSLFGVAHTIFQYADGKDIPVRSYADRLRLNSSEFSKHTGLNVSEDELDKLWKYFHVGQIDEFEKIWKGKRDCPQGQQNGCLHVVPVALAEMARLSLRSPWSYSQIQLPVKKSKQKDEVEIPGSGNEQYVAFDDGQAVQARVVGKWLSSELHRWKLKIQTQSGGIVNLLPNSITPLSDRLVELAFPSLKPFNPGNTVQVTYELNNGNGVPILLNYVKLTDAPAAKPVIRVLSSEVAAHADGNGEVGVEVISSDVRRFNLENTTALFTDSAGKTVPFITIGGATPNYIILPFRHLVPGRSVTIVARGSDGKELGKVSIPVIEGKGSGKKNKEKM